MLLVRENCYFDSFYPFVLLGCVCGEEGMGGWFGKLWLGEFVCLEYLYLFSMCKKLLLFFF